MQVTIESLIEEVSYINQKNFYVFAKTPSAKRMLKKYGQMNASSIYEETQKQIANAIIANGWTKEQYEKVRSSTGGLIVSNAYAKGDARAYFEVNKTQK
jgi:hypothetical protein